MRKKDTKSLIVNYAFYIDVFPRRMARVVTTLAILAFSPLALAIPPTFSIIAPNEFALPVPKPDHGITFFVQDTTYTNDDTLFGPDGDDVDTGQSAHSLLSVTRIGRLFSLSSLPKVGFYWEYLQPSAYVETGGESTTGLVDPLVGGGAYITPAENLTVGTEQFVQLPIGSDELSNHYFVYYPQLFFDYSIQGFGIDVLGGAAFKTDQRNNGNINDVGNDYYVDLRLRYELNHYLTPYFAYDFTTTREGEFKQVADDPTNNNVPGQAIPSATQHNVGGGVQIFLRKDHLSSLSVFYSRGIDGENAVQTNGVLTEFLYLFP